MQNSHPKSDELLSKTKVVYAKYQTMILTKSTMEIQEWSGNVDKYLAWTGNNDEKLLYI